MRVALPGSCESGCGSPRQGLCARFCAPCARQRKRRPSKYQWTEHRLSELRRLYRPAARGAAKAIAASWNWPSWVVKRKASELGLSRPRPDRRPWIEKEEAFLFEHCGQRTVPWMAKSLRRTVTSVALKIKRLKLRRAFTEGYTLRELELCFGVDHRRIERWIAAGQLQGERRGNGHARDGWAFTDADLWRFMVAHPTAFELAKVDQVWFMGLVAEGTKG